MAPTAASTSSTSKPAEPARSEAQPSEVREVEPAEPARSEAQPSEVREVEPAEPARGEAQPSEVHQAEVELGRVVGAHGLGGELRVQTASPDALRSGQRVRLRRGDGDPARSDEVAGVRSGRPGECRVRLAGVSDRESAEALRGSALWARAGDLPALAPGEYYQHQLIGCRAFAPDGRVLGVVRSIWETGAPDVLVIEQASGRELLVPASESLLRRIDVGGRRLVIELPPGLLDQA